MHDTTLSLQYGSGSQIIYFLYQFEVTPFCSTGAWTQSLLPALCCEGCF
jgi:hypothetical protein